MLGTACYNAACARSGTLLSVDSRMRWSIIRIIWLRELRDQLRDRRTVFMIAVLPIMLYPAAGFGLIQMAQGFVNQKAVVLVRGADNLPPPGALPAAAWFTITPTIDGGALAGAERLGAAAVLVQARLDDPTPDYAPLFRPGPDGRQIPSRYFESPLDEKALAFRFDDGPVAAEHPVTPTHSRDDEALDYDQHIDRKPLNNREVDLIVVFPPDFRARLEAGEVPSIYLAGRKNDDRSAMAAARVQGLLNRWKMRLNRTRLARNHLPADFGQLFQQYPKPDQVNKEDVSKEVFNLLAKILPVILIMWSLAGALYPAIDLCAGEKERGTMETLLISPASREEIVWGKFLTIWVFSGATALLNLISMGLTTLLVTPKEIPHDAFNSPSLFWGVVLLLPVSAFFSAVSLAVGAYARSSKEGQYYLMPLFMVTMPLVLLTIVPDVVLNPFWSMVPVTGVALLLQALIAPNKSMEGVVWYYFIPVLAPMLLYSWLALRWAIEQFKREEVLFREAERLDIGLWLKRLFREKERLPSPGEAVFCFVLIVLLNRLTISFGDSLPVLVQACIRYLAFMAAPALFMALLLTTRPVEGLSLRLPPWWAWPAAAVLAVFLLFPCVEAIRILIHQMPEKLEPLVKEHARSVAVGSDTAPGFDLSTALGRWLPFLAFVGIIAVSEEVAFRGFILSGLRQRFRPTTAVLLSAFLFALSQMNVFQFVPHFLLGVVLGFLVVRGGSLWPAILFHLLFNVLLTGPELLKEEFAYLGYADNSFADTFRILAVVGLILTGGMMYAIIRWTRPPSGIVPVEDAPRTVSEPLAVRPAEAATPTST